MTIGHLRVVDGKGWRFRLEGASACKLWYERIDAELPPVSSLDSALVGSLLYWMRQPVNEVRVHGMVSRTLLRNLEELQHVWASWRPGVYRRVEFIPDDLIEDTRTGEGAVASFSGGVDGAFTVYRHAIAAPGPHTLPLREVVMVQGFDISLDEDDVFVRAASKSERMLAEKGLPIALVRTNVKHDLGQSWEDAFGLCVASVLLTFQGTRRYGLIGSSEPYGALVWPWGSTPVQDWMASTGSMEIRHDGAGYTRSQKVESLTSWPAALRELRVCWKGKEHDRNCGKCEKCVRTILCFKATGQNVPPCFGRDVTEADIRRLRLPNRPAVFAEFASVLATAEQFNIQAPWINATRSMLRANRLRSSLPGRAARRARRFIRS